jgi:quercetin dioxygenase-like cupin family protein
MRKITPEVACGDDRGTITDLVHEKVDAVTLVCTKAGAIRGNHYHEHTTQWSYVVSGSMVVTTGSQEMVVNAGDIVVNDPGEPHAWKAIADTVCVVVARGPRAGGDYEIDTYRLVESLFA